MCCITLYAIISLYHDIIGCATVPNSLFDCFTSTGEIFDLSHGSSREFKNKFVTRKLLREVYLAYSNLLEVLCNFHGKGHGRNTVHCAG